MYLNNECHYGNSRCVLRGKSLKELELLARGFNMNIRYISGENTYQEDPRTGQYTEVRYMETPLTASVSNGRQNSVNLLLVAGTDVNCADSLGLTPLMHAVIHDKYAIQTMLVYKSADMNYIDHFYEMVLVKVVIRSRFNSAVQLLQNSA